MWFLPRTVGTAPVRAQPEAFVRSFARRIETGLLGPRRSRYAISRQERHGLAFRAADWPTALSVGLNDVELTVAAGHARYSIQYWRWAAYGVALSAAIGVGLAVLFLALDVREYVDRDLLWMIPGLTTDQNVAIAWSMVVFWGFMWPWILVGLHKRSLRQLMERLISEVDESARAGQV
ncbi:MAG TPA: hypothetical protein VHJ77_05720 [Vicinamibacterales bacterium]|jgi:hypothetical protein|nr:hypothetical protein [Vicinamibacterales bacterium]